MDASETNKTNYQVAPYSKCHPFPHSQTIVCLRAKTKEAGWRHHHRGRANALVDSPRPTLCLPLTPLNDSLCLVLLSVYLYFASRLSTTLNGSLYLALLSVHLDSG